MLDDMVFGYMLLSCHLVRAVEACSVGCRLKSLADVVLMSCRVSRSGGGRLPEPDAV